MPDVIWTVFADPANRGMLALTLLGLILIVLGPWAIVRFVSRQGAKRGGG